MVLHPRRGHCVVGKNLYSHSASLHPGDTKVQCSKKSNILEPGWQIQSVDWIFLMMLKPLLISKYVRNVYCVLISIIGDCSIKKLPAARIEFCKLIFVL